MKKKFEPYSKNIIFLDTEFSSLNPYKGEILSIGLIKLNGKELYLELQYKGYVDRWVKKNIIPSLNQKKVSRKTAVRRINKFVGSKKPYLISYVNQYDVIYLYKLFKDVKKPFFWLPIDFASILFCLGLNPNYIHGGEKFLKSVGVDTSRFRHSHNALDDARLLREIYLKMAA